MVRVLAVNGSPRRAKGNTALVLRSLLEGAEAAGAETETVIVDELELKPCTCGAMRCWYGTPGECCIRDGMDAVYPRLRAADTLVLASPVYVPLPGRMQDFLNRVCPLMEPRLEFHDGRTRARVRPGVALRRIALVTTGDWWERENSARLVGIARELAEVMNIGFAGAAIRPHALAMWKDKQLTPGAVEALAAAKRAGTELVRDGTMSEETLAAVSRPLVPEETLRGMYNNWLRGD
ncbi:flavodoxin family protein [candidate division WOR-3 bacterium]|nr:flavodoxin family protein [candidate division WOR-3 bacterium]